MWVIGAEDFAKRSSYFMFTASFFAVESVFMQSESVVARAYVRSYRISAFLLAATVVDSAFVFICNLLFVEIVMIAFEVACRCFEMLPVKNTAANPVFWTELSEANSIRRTLPSEVKTGGKWVPQKTPCFLSSFSLSLLRTSTWSYSQSC